MTEGQLYSYIVHWSLECPTTEHFTCRFIYCRVVASGFPFGKPYPQPLVAL